jgi:hypothetical protein
MYKVEIKCECGHIFEYEVNGHPPLRSRATKWKVDLKYDKSWVGYPVTKDDKTKLEYLRCPKCQSENLIFN